MKPDPEARSSTNFAVQQSWFCKLKLSLVRLLQYLSSRYPCFPVVCNDVNNKTGITWLVFCSASAASKFLASSPTSSLSVLLHPRSLKWDHPKAGLENGFDQQVKKDMDMTRQNDKIRGGNCGIDQQVNGHVWESTICRAQEISRAGRWSLALIRLGCLAQCSSTVALPRTVFVTLFRAAVESEVHKLPKFALAGAPPP